MRERKVKKPTERKMREPWRARAPVSYITQLQWLPPDQLAAEMTMAHSPDATRYVANTGLTKETIRNAVYCPACGAGAMYRCLYSGEFGPHTKERSRFHPERVAAAVEKLAPMVRDTGSRGVRSLVSERPGATGSGQ